MGDQICAMIEESHLITDIEGNSDVNLIFEFQMKNNEDDEV
jgi:hypothetical protein